jgi:hypothetical protein
MHLDGPGEKLGPSIVKPGRWIGALQTAVNEEAYLPER